MHSSPWVLKNYILWYLLPAPRLVRPMTSCPAARAHCRLMKFGSSKDTTSWNKILKDYSKFYGLVDARKLFDEIPQRDTVSWNSLIGAHVLHERYEDACVLFRTMMKKGLLFDEYTLGSVLKSVAGASHINVGCQLHSLIIKTGLDYNVFAGSALVDVYAKCGRVEDAYWVFVFMPVTNTVSWNAIISGYAQVGEISIVFWLFDRMKRESITPDEATFASILRLVDKAEYYKLMSQVHAKIIRYGWVMDTIVYNAALMAYSLCGSIVDSRKVFEEMGDFKDLVTWNSMLAAYACHSLTEQAIRLFVQMQDLGIDHDMYTFTSVISACLDNGQHSQGRVLHSLVTKMGLEGVVPISNALIAMYIRCNDGFVMEDAVKCFSLMEHKDTVSWNSILTGFSQNGSSEEALKFFIHMRLAHHLIDHYAFSATLRSCSDLAVLQLGQLIHGLALKSGFTSNDFVASSLIYMYSKCGVIDDARRSFDESHKDSSVTWNSIIFGYGLHGQGQVALGMFSVMQELDVKPDHITFVGILTACSHIGLVELGSKFLKSMEPVYGIPLEMEHYACGVDLFGRAGCLDEAMKLIKSMPFEPDAMVWMTLLGACRIHGNIELASHVARHLLVVEPREHSTYILLSNMFSGFGMWDGRAIVQKVMRNRGLSKVPGWSWIEVMKKVHAFNAEDRSHPQAVEIYEMLGMLMEAIEMKDHLSIVEILMHDLDNG